MKNIRKLNLVIRLCIQSCVSSVGNEIICYIYINIKFTLKTLGFTLYLVMYEKDIISKSDCVSQLQHDRKLPDTSSVDKSL